MYSLYDNFVSCNENKQPYSVRAERHTFIGNMSAWVEDGCFNMASIGNVYILNTPVFTKGSFRTDFKITYMEEIPPKFTVFFAYDEKTRKGKGIKFFYDLDETVKISLVDIDCSLRQIEKTIEYTKKNAIKEDAFYPFILNVENKKAFGSVAGFEFSFDVESTKGRVAVERDNFIGELKLDSVAFSSDEEFKRITLMKKVSADIPLINGGDIPYRVSWEIDRIDEKCYLTATLDGGTRTREVNRDDRPGQYVAEQDWMDTPYVGIGTKGGVYQTYKMADGEKAFIDPNIYWDCQKAFFGDTELPIINTYLIPESLLNDEIELIFGYENLSCSGYAPQQGASEFRFTKDGKLLYSGAPLDGRDIFELYSSENKYAMNFIPDDCYKREDVVNHIKYNHYFDVDEDIEFTYVFKTRKDTDYLEVEAEILNIFESQVLENIVPVVNVEKGDYGYNVVKAEFKVPKMKVGVYKTALNVKYGGKDYARDIKVFEVYNKDTDENPVIASGLPVQFSMPNEQKWLMRNAFDLWNPMPSCDIAHYYSCVTDTPIEAQTRKTWLLTKKFKRQWFAWISSRTCKDWSIDKYTDVVKNCDYLFNSINEEVLDLSQSTLFPIRQDHFDYPNFMMREEQRVAILDNFLRDNPEIAEKLDYKPGMKFTFDHFVNLMKSYHSEWIDYQNKAGLDIIREHNKMIEKINPEVKRAVYGPVNVYVTPTLTNHSIKAYGNSDADALSDEVFTGFSVFEDYPYACSYQTYKGAFCLMTILLHSPRLTVYPEQYSGSRGGCIDGAVKFAHAPMGAYGMEDYYNSTHAFEYVFNTPYKLKDGFHYWNTYGFHRGASSHMHQLVRDWRYAVENKPKKPLRTTAFLAEYSDCEDVFKVYTVDSSKSYCKIMNRSEMGHGVFFECTRESGLSCGFGIKYESLVNLKSDECDLIVLPGLKNAPPEAVGEIRRLYNEGVNLIAFSDVTGLEDIFEVKHIEKKTRINEIIYNGETEYVREEDALLMYEPDGTEVVMKTDKNEPVIFSNGRCALVNVDVTNLGESDSRDMCHAKSLHVVGSLIRKALSDLANRLSSPIVKGENVGTTLFETEDGRTMLLAIDYTPFDNAEHNIKEAVITVNGNIAKEAKSERALFVGKKNGYVKELRFDIKPHEFVFVELI